MKIKDEKPLWQPEKKQTIFKEQQLELLLVDFSMEIMKAK